MSIARNLSRTGKTQLRIESLESRLVPNSQPGYAQISGMVYADCNTNGTFDAGDTALAGVTINLINKAGDVVASTTTGSDGRYSFVYQNTSTSYTVTQIQPSGYADGPDYVGAVFLGSEIGTPVGTVAPPNSLTNIFVPDGGQGKGYDFTELCTPPEETGQQGLTPGFWKNNAIRHGASAWAGTGYTTTQTLGSVFNFTGTAFTAYANTTLVDALGLNGGGVNALLRHAVAGLLNASHTAVHYPLTTAQIISAVDAALAIPNNASGIEALKNELDGYNNLGANLNQHGLPG